jgi:hypothetical protein
MTKDQTPKLAPSPAPSQNNSFTISTDQKVQEKNILPGNQLKHNVFNGLGAPN